MNATETISPGFSWIACSLSNNEQLLNVALQYEIWFLIAIAAESFPSCEAFKSAIELPPSATALCISSPIFFALSLISFPSSSTTTILTTSSTLAAGTTSLRRSHSLTITPTFKYSVNTMAFLGWSICIGHAMIGTPKLKLSITEFQPQWLTKAAVDGCANMSTCGAHPFIIIPNPSISSSNPAGKPPVRLSTSDPKAPSSASLICWDLCE
ncbi:hypothetical protein M5K25_009474 [Dendrobium thyrsiflorum]|uniref:Uncharacterized protein n=1 Tax=Dendrobium thyrsiflorum TaxID=117978 RepID=A0ABD0VCL8_DENTH